LFRVLVIAGTADARCIIEELVKSGVNITATVTTRLGKDLLSAYEQVDAREGRLILKGMVGLIEEVKPGCLIDASHPFAREVSLNAIKACKKMSIPYMRYERAETVLYNEKVIRVSNFEEAAEEVKNHDGNIFLTIGSGKLEMFTGIPGIDKKRIFIRVLPESKVIEKCERLGLDARNIFAMKGPFSEEMNMELLKHCNASVMVTKDSGSIGGSEKKISAARKLGIPVLMVDRPEIEYGCVVHDVDDVVAYVKNIKDRRNDV
jgi:precorrin-6A/cobalt-precorrin-6A reductase